MIKGKAGGAGRTKLSSTEELQVEIAGLKKSDAVHRHTISALRKSEAYFRAITHNSYDMVIVVDKKANITYVNPSVERLLGYTPEELIGRSGFNYISISDIPRAVYDFGWAVVTNGVDIPNSFIVKHKDGSERILEGVGRNLFNDPVVGGFVMNVRDITERKRAEEELNMYRRHLEDLVRERTAELTDVNSRLLVELSERKRVEAALRESEKDYRDIMENSPIGFCIIDTSGKIQFVNRMIEDVSGWMREELIGKDGLSIEFFNEETRLLLDRRLAARLRGEPEQMMDIPIKCKDGKQLWVEFKTTILMKDGVPSGALLAITDNTQRRQAEEERSSLEKQLLHSQKMEAMGVLASGVAHDFNNVLMAIMGYAELMKVKTTDDKNYPYLDLLLSASGRAKELVNQILTFSRRKEGEKKPVVVTPIVKEVVRFLRSSLPGTISIHQSCSNHMDTVIADSTQIYQVLMNLCTNAVQAMRGRGGTLRIILDQEKVTGSRTDCHPELREGTYLRMRVIDTGCGIDPSIMDRIFDPFFTTKEAGEGTGLGLSVVYGIVRNHNGVVHASSEPGKGSVFTVYLPLAATDNAAEAAETEPVPGGNERILLVDDEEYVLSIEREMLASLGYDVSCRRSSLDALDAFRAVPDRFDLVITDISMPNMTGINLSREILKIRPNARIILATGFSEIFTEQEAIDMGMKAFMTKPISMNRLARKVREALDCR